MKYMNVAERPDMKVLHVAESISFTAGSATLASSGKIIDLHPEKQNSRDEEYRQHYETVTFAVELEGTTVAADEEYSVTCKLRSHETKGSVAASSPLDLSEEFPNDCGHPITGLDYDNDDLVFNMKVVAGTSARCVAYISLPAENLKRYCSLEGASTNGPIVNIGTSSGSFNMYSAALLHGKINVERDNNDSEDIT